MLTNQGRSSRRVVALLLTIVMLNVYVLMGAKTSRASGNTSAEGSDSGKLLVGRLALADQQRIFVNGNEAPTGTSIFSGMRLQSPLGVNAVVQLADLGQVSLEPSTDLTLDFSNGHVAVTVTSGEATLTTNDGVEGTLTAADGNVMKSEGTKASVLSSSARASAAKMSGKRKAAWIIIPVVAVIIIIAIVVADDDNNSPA